MKYLGYIPLIVAFCVGFYVQHPMWIVPCVIASTFLFMSTRRKQAKKQLVSGPIDLIADGAYLLAIQGLIKFTAYLLGWFITNNADTLLSFLGLG